ncbi:MAG TPA: hypothetical protein VG939_20085, partial [Caulobacteraceae bacterium]|nr:hypothetical protein [Caulobacteraceae bacterium]
MADDASLRIADLAADEVIRLWPGAPPVEGASAGPEQAYVGMVGRTATTMYRNVSDPSLHVFRPDPAKANGVGVIIAPGGGWQILAWEHEGVVLARWLAARGYAAFVLRYRVLQTPADPKAYAEASATQSKAMADRLAERGALSPSSVLRGERVEKGRALALADGRRAMELVRERAKAFGVDPQKVGMIGFSAGAFLVADVALNGAGAAPMAFCAPIYGGAIGEDA